MELGLKSYDPINEDGGAQWMQVTPCWLENAWRIGEWDILTSIVMRQKNISDLHTSVWCHDSWSSDRTSIEELFIDSVSVFMSSVVQSLVACLLVWKVTQYADFLVFRRTRADWPLRWGHDNCAGVRYELLTHSIAPIKVCMESNYVTEYISLCLRYIRCLGRLPWNT
jgi:hypothetical protein